MATPMSTKNTHLTLLQLTAASLFALTSTTAALAQDPYEPNDDCASTPLLPLGLTTGLTLGPNSDFFLIDVPANADIIIDTRDGMGASLDVRLFEVGCAGAPVADSSGTGAPLRFFDCGGVARSLVINVPDGGLIDAPYTIDVSAAEIVDDGLEDNDTCGSGALVALSSFTTANMVVTGCDEDYYVARLQGTGIELQVDLLFAHAQGDVDLELWDLGCTTLLASSASLDDNESALYVNNSNPSVAQAVVIRVFMKNGVGFADYALTVCFADQTLPTLGAQACAGVVNSTGRPATLCGRGSNVAASNQAYFYVVDLPMGSAGYFITSPAFQFTPTPGNTMGNLCLGAPGRYSFDVLLTQSGSAVFYQPNLNQTPVAGGAFTAITGGTRQFWQYWYRDSVGGVSTSNFSSALCVDFI
jgi:hypothetical protein